MAWRLPTYPVYVTPTRQPVHYVPLMHISSPFSPPDYAQWVTGPSVWLAPHCVILFPSLCNCTSITSFKSQLKNHLFKLAFPDDF